MTTSQTTRDPDRLDPLVRESVPWLPHPFSLIWRDGALCHWPVDPDRLRPHVPDRFTLETFDGQAWLTVVPFVLARAGIRGTPAPLRTTRPVLSLRTPTRYRDIPGLYHFSVDVGASPTGPTLGRLLGFPCNEAHQRVGGTDDRTDFASQRHGGRGGRFAASYRPVDSVSWAAPESLAHWLTERRRLFVPAGRRTLLVELGHEPWPLRPASITITENDLFEAAGLPTPRDGPIAHCCDRLEMTASIPRVV